MFGHYQLPAQALESMMKTLVISDESISISTAYIIKHIYYVSLET